MRRPPNKQTVRRQSVILEALRSLAVGPLCYATNKQIAEKAGYSLMSRSVPQGLEELEGESVDRYFESGTRRRFYLILDHPEAAAFAADVERQDRDAPRASRCNSKEEKQASDNSLRRHARNALIVGLESCESIYEAIGCVTDYLRGIPSGDMDECRAYVNERESVEYALKDHKLICKFINTLSDREILGEVPYQAAWDIAEEKLLVDLREDGVGLWADALETGNWRLIAREREALAINDDQGGPN